ncbi:CocE/NonD family hydrolase C-terminal non-catalytic domain-containing protein [Rhodococcus sp. LB1]|uniref:CocE/NonD family hydrolase C-terminal non-catalytic domain-containing protein n=1 Tax=Rhodococcus sp. LB1 TaxID=1807499 RepID=UPI0012E87AD4
MVDLHCRQAGHRLRVQVSSSNFPRRDRNPTPTRKSKTPASSASHARPFASSPPLSPLTPGHRHLNKVGPCRAPRGTGAESTTRRT